MKVILVSIGLFAIGCKSDEKPPTATTDTATEANANKPATEIDRTAYRSAVKKGRALVKDKKYPEAAAAFREALAAVADDAEANSELSLALYLAKDYPGAEAAARASIDRASGRVKAASLYNLALALEKRDKKADAIRALEESLALRPHQAVAAKLARLTGEKKPDPLSPIEWSMYSSVDALCAAIVPDDEEEKEDFRCPGRSRPIEVPAGGPIKAGLDLELNKHMHHNRVLLQTDAGWFESENYWGIEVGIATASSAVKKVELVTSDGRDGVAIYRIDLELASDAEVSTEEINGSWFCGAARKKESIACTPLVHREVRTRLYDQLLDPPKWVETTERYKVDIDANAVLTVAKVGDFEVTYGNVGVHKLEF